MFMITAIGTPILYENNDVLNEQNNIISADYLKSISKTKKIISELSEGNAIITNEFWELVINNEIKEAFDFLLEKLSFYIKQPFITEFEIFRSNYIRYLTNLDINFIIDKFYKYLQNSTNTEMNIAIYKIIEELNLIDFNKINQLLQSDNHTDKKNAIFLTRFDKQFYTNEDIIDLEKIVHSIENNVKEIVIYTIKKKGMFSSEEIEVWKCPNLSCEITNNRDDKSCRGCNIDKFGYNSKFYNRNSAIKNLNGKIQILKEQLT